MAAVNPQVLPLSAARASQAVRMEQFDEFGVAGVLVEIVEQGEVHGQNLRATRGIPVEDTTARGDRQEAEHRIPLMSHESFLGRTRPHPSRPWTGRTPRGPGRGSGNNRAETYGKRARFGGLTAGFRPNGRLAPFIAENTAHSSSSPGIRGSTPYAVCRASPAGPQSGGPH